MLARPSTGPPPPCGERGYSQPIAVPAPAPLAACRGTKKSPASRNDRGGLCRYVMRGTTALRRVLVLRHPVAVLEHVLNRRDDAIQHVNAGKRPRVGIVVRDEIANVRD